MRIRVEYWYFGPFIAYLLLSTAAIFPKQMDNFLFPVNTLLVLLIVLIIQYGADITRYATQVMLLVFPVVFIFILLSLRTQDPETFLKIIEGAFISPILISAIVAICIGEYGLNNFYRALIRVTFTVLIMTIVYKVVVGGLYDRGVRFFLNGPIIFGWFMGLAAFLSLVLLSENKRFSLAQILYFFLFIAGLLWTQSKGPLVAFIMTTSFYFIPKMLSKRSCKIISVISIVAIGLLPFIPDVFFSRLETLIRILTFSTTAVDSGTVGIRELMWLESYTIFLENPLVGVGVGNWQFYSGFEYLKYPHNIVAELASETGIIGLITIFGYLGFLFYSSPFSVRCVMIYFLTCMMFSGNFYYFRFVIFLPLACKIHLAIVNNRQVLTQPT